MPSWARLNAGSLVIFDPLKIIEPDVGDSKPVIMLNRVVFPAPFGPIKEVMLPSLTFNVQLLSALIPANCLVRFRTSRLINQSSLRCLLVAATKLRGLLAQKV